MTDLQGPQGPLAKSFDFSPSTRVHYGLGALARLGEVAVDLGGKRVLLVTDPGLEAAGHAQHAQQTLRAAGLTVFMFDGVEENPTTKHVADCVSFAQERAPIDLIVALGGGSSMDCAKGANFLLTNGGQMEDYWGDGLAKQPMLPSIGIPTTAGTGSEAQRFALISHETTHRKMACGDVKARFRAVILDPLLLGSAPRQVVAATGLDAVTHALESFVTSKRNLISQLFAKEAWRLLEAHIEKVLRGSADAEDWGAMLLGSHFAGAAIENAMLGAAHACANPLTARFQVTHGVAVGLMLPHVIRFNRSAVGHLYEELARTAGMQVGAGDSAEWLASRVEGILQAAGLPASLSAFEIGEPHVPGLAENAKTQWTGGFNPRPLSVGDYEALYRAAL